MSLAYCINEADLIYDTIEGDVIMLNMKNGKYYTVNETGAFIWSLVQKGCSVGNIVNLMRERFLIEVQALTGHVSAFLKQLVDEELILQHSAPPKEMVLPAITGAAGVYLPPSLDTFRDFILLSTFTGI